MSETFRCTVDDNEVIEVKAMRDKTGEIEICVPAAECRDTTLDERLVYLSREDAARLGALLTAFASEVE